MGLITADNIVVKLAFLDANVIIVAFVCDILDDGVLRETYSESSVEIPSGKSVESFVTSIIQRKVDFVQLLDNLKKSIFVIGKIISTIPPA